MLENPRTHHERGGQQARGPVNGSKALQWQSLPRWVHRPSSTMRLGSTTKVLAMRVPKTLEESCNGPAHCGYCSVSHTAVQKSCLPCPAVCGTCPLPPAQQGFQSLMEPCIWRAQQCLLQRTSICAAFCLVAFNSVYSACCQTNVCMGGGRGGALLCSSQRRHQAMRIESMKVRPSLGHLAC